MAAMKRLLPLLFLFSAALLTHAQTVPTHATADDIDHWLRSGDPRMVAWGATFAASTADKDELPVLASLAENYQPTAQPYDSRGNYISRTLEQKQRLDSMQCVLDALIQLHASVPYEAIAAVFPDFSAQALILFATMPEPERSQRAAEIYATRDPSDKPFDWHQATHQQIVHMAAAILALKPPPGFTATLFQESAVTLKISVTDENKGFGTGFGGGCGDSFEIPPARGWPQSYNYVVEQHWKSEGSVKGLLIPGDPAITSRRAITNSSCSWLRGFTSVERLQLAQQEAGLSGNSFVASSLQSDTVHYEGPADYLSALSDTIDRHRQLFRDLAKTLAARTFLTPAEAASAMPAFIVEIDDKRQDKSHPLATPTSFGPRITITPYKTEPAIPLQQ